MAGRPLRTLVEQLRRSVNPHADDSLTDAQLLQRWAHQRDEAAFEVLLWRHGPMVLSVCRRLLRDSHDVEDAFQAAFLTLVRKGASIRRPQALAGWLYRVAYRIVLRLRSESAERARREQSDIETLTSSCGEERPAYNLREVLDEEIDALPERYRQAFVLCYLQGKTHAEAGRLLGKPTGTISCWLKRGRELLRCRLAQRGIASMAIAALGESEATAALPAALVQSTYRAANAFVAGGETAAAISARVAMLVEGAVKRMSAAKLQWAILLGLTLSLAATGAGMWVYQPSAPSPLEKREAETEAYKQPQRQETQAVRTDRYGDPLPEGAVTRLGTVRQRAIKSQVALTPDGKTIVTVNGEVFPQIKIFDAATGKLRERRELPGGSISETIVCLSSDGRWLSVQQNDSSFIDIWDISTNKVNCRLRPRQGRTMVQGVFSADGKTLAVSEHNKSTGKSAPCLWDITSGMHRDWKEFEGQPQCFAFSPDGKLLAAKSENYIICYDVQKGQKLWQATSVNTGSLAFAPDGRTVIVAPGEMRRFPLQTLQDYQFFFRKWRETVAWIALDAATGQPVHGIKLPDYLAVKFAVAPDNRTLLFAPSPDLDRQEGSDGRVCLWDLQTGKQIRRLASGGLIGPFFPDGKSFLTTNGVLQHWELATGRPLLPDSEKLGHRAEITRMIYSPDGRRLASTAGDGTIRLWDVATAKPLHVLQLRESKTTDLAFTPDGKQLVSGPDNDELFIWDTETGKEIQRRKLDDPSYPFFWDLFSRLHLSTDGRLVTVVGFGTSAFDKGKLVGIVSRWDLATGQRKSRAESMQRLEQWDAISPDGQLLLVNGELLDTATAKRRAKLDVKEGGFYAFSSDGRLVAGMAVTREPKGGKIDWDEICLEIRIWETKTGRVLHRVPIPRRGAGPLALSPDGRYLAVAGMREIRIWDLSTEKVVLRHKAHEPLVSGDICSFASCLSFSPDGRTLATGHPDSTILIWNAVPPESAASSEPRP